MSIFNKAINKIRSATSPKPKMVFISDSKFYSKYELQVGGTPIGRFEIDKDVKEFEGGKYWGILLVKIDNSEYLGQGYGLMMYRKMLDKLPDDIAGLYSEPFTRHNNVQVPKIHDKLNTVTGDNNVVFINKNGNIHQ
jgi:hypothetical protein